MTKLYVVARIHWEYNDNWYEKAYSNEPVKAFRRPDKAHAYCKELERETRQSQRGDIPRLYPDNVGDKQLFYEIVTIDWDESSGG